MSDQITNEPKSGNSLDLFEVSVVPVNKLDADQYSADDLDGVTESVFGSGNMAYASLQASQTQELLNANAGNLNMSDYIAGVMPIRPQDIRPMRILAIAAILMTIPWMIAQGLEVLRTWTGRLIIRARAKIRKVRMRGLRLYRCL